MSMPLLESPLFAQGPCYLAITKKEVGMVTNRHDSSRFVTISDQLILGLVPAKASTGRPRLACKIEESPIPGQGPNVANHHES
jgi:hypothetical protein